MNAQIARRSFLAAPLSAFAQPDPRPSILMLVSDDQSWLHTGIGGTRALRTPAFDGVARDGILFNNAYCSSPSCAPSRAAMLTGQHFWQLEAGANMRAHLPAKFPTYTGLLEAAGYRVGSQGKGYGPTNPADKSQNPAGRKYASFAAFLKETPAGRPFCYWFGSTNPHRPYVPGGWRKSGRWTLADAEVPAYLPDTPEIRGDILDYYAAIEAYDRESAAILKVLDEAGLAANTLVVMTSDNGMSFPRAKCNLYDWGTRMPLAIRWPQRVKRGQVSDSFVSQTDFAPTFLAAAGINKAAAMTGESLLNMDTALPRTDRTFVVTGRERHSTSRNAGQGYPCRALRTRDFLYVRNFKPERWPAGDPPGSADVDPSPSRTLMAADRSLFSQLAFDRRPEEELYDLRKDPAQMHNVAALPAYQTARKKAAAQLTAYLRQTRDPRITGDGDVFDRYPFWGGAEHA